LNKKRFCFGGLPVCVSGSRGLKPWGHVRQLALFGDLLVCRVRNISADFYHFYGRCSRLQGSENVSDYFFTVWICGNVVVRWFHLAGDILVNMPVKRAGFTKRREFFVDEDIYCQLVTVMAAL
jgi:hypothetical protein